MISIHIARLDESVSSLVLQMQLPSSELTDPQLWEKENAHLQTYPWGGRYVSSQEGIRNI